jgi:hypothetical protein
MSSLPESIGFSDVKCSFCRPVPVTLQSTTNNNNNDAARFLRWLDPEAMAFTFQTFDDARVLKNGKLVPRADKRLARVLHGTLIEHAAELRRLNKLGAGVFVTINETDGRGRTIKNIVRIRAVFVDLDGAPLDPVIKSSTPPHMVTESSPGRYQAFMLVREMPLDRFSGIQRSLAAQLSGDPSVNDLPRVMRLPGFFHRKGEPFVTRIVTINEHAVYETADFELPSSIPAHLTDHKPDSRGSSQEPLNKWQQLNTEALARLDDWVPALFGEAATHTPDGRYRITSVALGRDLQEDLSISPQGIKDFGIHDLKDDDDHPLDQRECN